MGGDALPLVIRDSQLIGIVGDTFPALRKAVIALLSPTVRVHCRRHRRCHRYVISAVSRQRIR